ncbi:MAG: hypothetical protein EA398_12190 [Deltaproteobacteria bacterium]|nr:MAG: hypothetical protein EA398_12190 [Deltaproteobacteria bacterium]
MNVVFLSPNYPPEMQQYTRGLAEVGARVLGVGDTPVSGLAPVVRRSLVDYLQVPRMLDEEDVIRRVHHWLRGRSVDRVLANWEVLVMTAARLRERFGMEGMDPDTVRGFRDKQVMKERVRAAGLRTARSRRVRTVAEVEAAVAEIGYPLILKPIDGAGSANTWRLDGPADLPPVLRAMRSVPEASCEEFITGEEFTYDTLCVGGRPVFENVAQYLPPALVARTREELSPIIITVRDMDAPKYGDGVALGRSVLGALGMGDGFTHMEWFRTGSGEAIFGEIGCRPGGANLVDQMNWSCDIDLFREWARVACFGSFAASAERRYNCAIIFKRARGQGRITRIEGLRSFLADHGKHVVADQLLRPGSMRRNWKNTLLSDGFLAVRHPDWDTTRRIAEEAAERVVLHAGG